ncbi:MAG: hypothetical protein C0459_02025 [Chitinophaga sp.]|jgi:YcxB-like protein|nr:hypothetical protein [Chitinophaga sp.]
MQFSFSYDKKKVLQALRYHFVSRQEIRVMIILVNVFALTSAALFYFKKIRPEPFFLGTFIWVMMMVSVWYILPNIIYKKSSTFKEAFTINFSEHYIVLENNRGYVNWEWSKFSKFIESPHFFHLYFDTKSFFLVPKDTMMDDDKHTVRGLLKEKIG